MKCIFTFFCCIFFVWSICLLGKTRPEYISREIKDSIYSPNNEVAWGISFAEGDGTLGRDEGEFMFTTLYKSFFAEQFAMEYAVHYIGVQRYRDFQGIISKDSIGYISLSFIADASLIFKLGTNGIWQSFSVGVGPSYRVLSWLGRESLSLGLNAKGMYEHPITDKVTISLRGQIHLFASAFVSLGAANVERFGSIGNASLGCFITLKF